MEGSSHTFGVSIGGGMSLMGPSSSTTYSYSHSRFNSTARSKSTATGHSSSHTENWNQSQMQNQTHADAIQNSQSSTESKGLAKAITEALQYSISEATAVSQGTNFRHMRAEALSDVVNTFFRDHISQFPRAVLTDDVEQCDLPWFERPLDRLDVSSVDCIYGEVKPAELEFVEPKGMKMTMPTGLLDWQYPAGDQLIPNQTEPILSFRIKLAAEKKELQGLRLLDIAFSISDISFKPQNGARYDIEIGGRKLSAQDRKEPFDIKAFSHCRNFVNMLADEVKEIEIKFTKRVVLTAVQVLVCKTTARRIAENLQGEENLLMLQE